MKTINILTEEDRIQHGLTKSGKNAYRSALSNGVAVTVLKGDEIQRVYPDGSKSVIKKISINNKKNSALRFRVK